MNIFPNFLNNKNFKYIILDSKYISTIIVKAFPENFKFLQKYILDEFNLEYTIYIQKVNKIKMLKKLTYNISLNNSEIKSIGKNQIDIDVLSKLTDDAKKLRYEIQINNQDVFYVNIYISVISDNLEKHLYRVKGIINKLFINQISSNMANFRHLEGYLSCLPLNNNLIKNNELVFTTNNLIYSFPFVTKNIIDNNGILFGYQKNNQICIIDVFNYKYLNANMCIFGSSGSGKSYFTKLLILRRFLLNNKQYIFDPEGEYNRILSYIELETFNINKSINIMDIYEENILLYKDKFLDNKILELIEITKLLANIKNLNEELLYSLLLEVYNDFNINFDINSMYINDVLYLNKKIKSYDNMPTVVDIIKKIKLKNQYKEFKGIFDMLYQNYCFFCKKTTINFNEKVIAFDLSKINCKEKVIKILFKIIKIKILSKKEKSLIYIDEIWKFLRKENNSIDEIYNIFKTIRKYNAGIITITQDIDDLFYNNLNLGKVILNNSEFRIFFKMEYKDKEVFDNLNIIDKNIIKNINSLNRGEMIMQMNNNDIELKIISSKFEDNIIEGDENDNSSNE